MQTLWFMQNTCIEVWMWVHARQRMPMQFISDRKLWTHSRLRWGSLVENTSHTLSQLMAGSIKVRPVPQLGEEVCACFPPDFAPGTFFKADFALYSFAVINHSLKYNCRLNLKSWHLAVVLGTPNKPKFCALLYRHLRLKFHWHK